MNDQNDSQTESRSGCIPLLVLLGCVGGVLAVSAEYFAWPSALVTWIEDHRDRDGDGVVGSTDDCPTVAGGTIVWSDEKTYYGCPDADPDKDGFYVKIEGGIWFKEEKVGKAKTDKCPNIAGDTTHNGCPPPTPEQVAMTSWLEVEEKCGHEDSFTSCFNAALSREPINSLFN